MPRDGAARRRPGSQGLGFASPTTSAETSDRKAAAARDQVLAAAGEATDVVVFSHGWWNSEATAECRYRQVIDGLRARKPAALGE